MQLAHEEEEDLNYNLQSKIPIEVNHIKLLVFSIVTAVIGVAGIFFWYYPPCLPSRATVTARRKRRSYTPLYFNREHLSQPLGNFLCGAKRTGLGRTLFLFDWCCQHVIWSLPPSASARWECLHCTCALRCTRARAPSAPSLTDPTFWSLDCHLDEAQLQPSPSTEQSQKRKDSSFSSVFSWVSMSYVFTASFLKLELSCKFYAYGKDQILQFFPFFTGNCKIPSAACCFCKWRQNWDYLLVSNKCNTLFFLNRSRVWYYAVAN